VVVVLAHQFFDIQTEEALAAFYQIPYYSGLFLIKRLIDRLIDFIDDYYYY
jgi:hypothetical protein